MTRNRKERKRLESPQIMRDAYSDRAFTKQQRMQNAALPVLESNPSISIDDTGQHTLAPRGCSQCIHKSLLWSGNSRL